MRGPKASLGLEARGPAAQWSLSSPGLMTFPPSCQHLGLQFGSVWAQAGMPSAAPPGRPAGGGLSYSWNSCFHVPERERGAGAVHPEQNLVGPRSPGPAAVLGAPGVGCCSACPGVTTPPPVPIGCTGLAGCTPVLCSVPGVNYNPAITATWKQTVNEQ